MIWVNFKTYKEGTGENAVELARVCEEVARESQVEIIPVVQTVDLYRISLAVRIPLWVQHIDVYPQGQYTGWVNLESVVESGASGTLLDHAEHKVPPGIVNQVAKRRDQQSNNLAIKQFKVMVCCRTLGQAERLAKLKPDFLAYEPPELIAGDLSVSEAKPNVVERIIKLVHNIPVVVGAGIKSSKDVRKSLELGAVGVLVSSAVVLADNPKAVLADLVSGVRR